MVFNGRTLSLIRQSGDANHAPSEAFSLTFVKSGRRKHSFYGIIEQWTIHKARRPVMKKRFLSLLCVLALCLGLLPVTAEAAAEGAPSSLYVGNQQVISSSDITYWTTDESTGGLTKYEGNNDNWNVKYDQSTATLTLKNANISGSFHQYDNPYTAGIYAQGKSNQPVALTIELIGTNTITGTYGIFLNAEINASSYGTDASLTITSENNGSLQVSGSNHGIYVKSGTGNASLNIKNVAVTSSTDGEYAAGVYVMSSNYATNSPNISLSVDGGSLTASGTGSSDGIWFYVGSSQATGATTSLTVSENAIVDARNGGISALKISETLPTPTPTGDNRSGIVFDGSTGTVYGNVTLDESLTINQGETLTVPDGSSLNCNGNLTNNGTIIVEKGGNLTGDPGGTVISAPTIGTQPASQSVTVGQTASFTVEATGEKLSYQWQQSTDSGQSWTDIGGATDATYTTEATTTSMNGYQYRCVVSNSAGSITSDAVSLTVNEHVHTWGNPVWSWSEDGKTCTVTFTCQNGETHKETPAVTVTSAVKTPATCTETGVTTYTATVEFNGQTYTDTKEVADIPATGHRYENGKCTVCSAVDPAFKAMIIEGANGKWQKGSEDALSFTSNAAFAGFLKVQIDGKDVDSSNYTVKEGSTIVTLKPSYLETLSAGKHTLAIVSDTGTAETEFTVVVAEKQVVDDESANDKAASDGDKESLAKTGDDSMLPITVLSILAVASIATGVFALRKSRI